jgi:hypothetical protein
MGRYRVDVLAFSIGILEFLLGLVSFLLGFALGNVVAKVCSAIVLATGVAMVALALAEGAAEDGE